MAKWKNDKMTKRGKWITIFSDFTMLVNGFVLGYLFYEYRPEPHSYFDLLFFPIGWFFGTIMTLAMIAFVRSILKEDKQIEEGEDK